MAIRRYATALICLAFVTPVATRAMRDAPHPAVADTARDVLDRAIAAMGGEPRLTSIKSLTLDSIGHVWALEQSERPEGPWLAVYRQKIDVRDYEHQQRSLQSQQRFWSSAQWSRPARVVVANGIAATTNGERWGPSSPRSVADWERESALAPERVLLTARNAADARVLPDETQQRVRQQPVAFTWNGMKLKLWLNAYTHLPTGLEMLHNDDTYGIWGDVTERRWYSFWTLEAGGLMYPRQTTTEWNGLPYSDETTLALTVDGPVDQSAFAIPDDVRAAYEKLKSQPAGLASLQIDEKRLIEVAPNVWQLQGGFNVGIVRQPDGFVIIEGTTSTRYVQQVIELLGRRFPGVAIKSLVTTSDAWPHVGGVREYVGRGVPIYPLDLNVALLSRILEAPRTMAPDTTPARAPIFRPVAQRTVVGSGDTRVELIPVRGEYGERMMLVWIPGQKLLYTSDLIQPDRSALGFFMPAMLAEVAATVEREKIDGIDRIFGMHLPPTPWSRVLDALAAARRD